MYNSRKSDGVDYKNTFARRISGMHDLIREVLSARICNGDHILDIGGGPGMDASPVVFIQRPMDLTLENPGRTALMANVAVFKLNRA
ncbi:MAG: hypothetical protein M8353_01335 [ANME-2 cluster archaeon]|nr:hypothetical protein [ANME-2 cluster archaeon]